MSKTIEINIEGYTPEQVQKIEALKAEIDDESKGGLFKPTLIDIYWTNGCSEQTGVVNTNHSADEERIAIGNCYRTEAEAKRAFDFNVTNQKLINILLSFGGGKDFSYRNKNWMVVYDYEDIEWRSSCCAVTDFFAVFFESSQDVERALNYLNKRAPNGPKQVREL